MSLKRSSLFQNPDYLINQYLQLTPIFVSSLKDGTKKIPSYFLTLFYFDFVAQFKEITNPFTPRSHNLFS